MPDNQGKLTPEEQQTVTKWLIDRWKTTNCPFHGPTQWEIGDATGTQPFAGVGAGTPGSGPVVGGAAYPLVVLTCGTCGYTIHINLIKVGIVKMRPGEDLPTPRPTISSVPPPEPKAE